jgi:hypothetical protein
LERISIPDTFTTIDEYGYSGTGIKEIVLPSHVESFQDHAFADCKLLVKATVPTNVDEYDGNEDGWYAFSGCNNL